MNAAEITVALAVWLVLAILVAKVWATIRREQDEEATYTPDMKPVTLRRVPRAPIITPEIAELYRLEVEAHDTKTRRAAPKSNRAASRRATGSGRHADVFSLHIHPGVTQ